MVFWWQIAEVFVGCRIGIDLVLIRQGRPINSAAKHRYGLAAGSGNEPQRAGWGFCHGIPHATGVGGRIGAQNWRPQSPGSAACGDVGRVRDRVQKQRVCQVPPMKYSASCDRSAAYLSPANNGLPSFRLTCSRAYRCRCRPRWALA
jgi:hypothetical protein